MFVILLIFVSAVNWDTQTQSNADLRYVNVVGDTMTGDLNLNGNQLLAVVNITSPFANKAYISFFTDGSIGLTLR